MREFESPPSLIENIIKSALLTVTIDEKGQLINFKNTKEAAGTISEQLDDAGLVSLKEDVSGDQKTVSTKIMIGGKEKILELKFIFDPQTSSSSLKEISINEIN